jgi:hypothetical protein
MQAGLKRHAWHTVQFIGFDPSVTIANAVQSSSVFVNSRVSFAPLLSTHLIGPKADHSRVCLRAMQKRPQFFRSGIGQKDRRCTVLRAPLGP